MRSIYTTGRGDRANGRGECFNGQGRVIGRGGRGVRGRGIRIQGGCGGGSGVYENGIDISDVTR